MGLENCAFEKGRKERPVLEHLRRSYAEKVVRKEDPSSYYFLVDEIKLAHFQRVLGNKPNAREKILNILNDLEFHESLETEQIILRMTEIIKIYFPLNPDARKRRFFKNIFARNRKLFYEDNGPSHFPNPFRDAVLLNHFNAGYVDLSGSNHFFEETIEDWKRGKSLWQD